MKTVQEALQAELRKHEKIVAQLRGKMAMLKHRAPDVLNVAADRIYVHPYTRGVNITIYDEEHKQPELPVLLLNLSSSDIVHKSSYESPIGKERMEYFSYFIAGVSIDLDRKPKMTKKCRKARIQRVVDICGEPSSDVEVIEWITDGEQ